MVRFEQDTDLRDQVKQEEEEKNTVKAVLLLSYSALGIVFGDIATAPLYAYQSIFEFSGRHLSGHVSLSRKLGETAVQSAGGGGGEHGDKTSYSTTYSSDELKGAMSLIFWSLTLVVVFKYMFLVINVHDQGEGGTFALYSLLCRVMKINPSWTASKADTEEFQYFSEKSATLNRKSGRYCPTGSKRLSSGGSSQTSWTRIFYWLPIPSRPFVNLFHSSSKARMALLITSIVATSMVIGDGVITPCISVVSAISGLGEKSSVTQSGIIGISITILFILFSIQSFGVHRIARLFTPITIIWLASITGIGIYNLVAYDSSIAQGLSPHYIYLFFKSGGSSAWMSLGGVMLVLTGVEGIYVELGHFSIWSIRLPFCLIIYPCLVICYLGQGAYLLENPDAILTTFWSSVPKPFYWPMIVISTTTTVVACQSIISSSYAIISNAMKLGFFPKLKVIAFNTGVAMHNVYIPAVNWLLFILCVAEVLIFGGNIYALANAYGIVVSSVMLITTTLVSLVLIIDWKLSALLVIPFWLLFSFIEGAFLSANLIRVPNGGWFTIAISAGASLIMIHWVMCNQVRLKAVVELQPKESLSEMIQEAQEDQESSTRTFGANTSFTPLKESSAADTEKSVNQSSKDALERSIHRRGSMTKITEGSPGYFNLPLSKSPDSSPLLSPNLSPPQVPVDSRRIGSGTHVDLGHVTISIDPLERASPSDSDMAREAERGSASFCRPSQRPSFSPRASPNPPALRLNSAQSAELFHTYMPLDAVINASASVLMRAGSAQSARESTHDRPEEDAGASAMTLKGLGIYYTESSDGCPPVMWHWLRNIEALHEIAVLLEVRFLPIPFLLEEERLAIVPVPGLPSFYRVAARYGYMDEVDHGIRFISNILSAIKKKVEESEGHVEGVPMPSPHVTIEEEEEVPAEDRDNPLPGMSRRSRYDVAPDISLSTFVTPPSPPQSLSPSPPHSPFAVASQSEQPRLSPPEVTRVPSRLRHSSGHVRFQDPDPPIPLLPIASGKMSSGGRGKRREQNASLLETIKRVREVAHTHNGTVYYLGAMHLRMRAMSNGVLQALHDICFEPFRLVFNNQHNEAEAWHIPLKSLIELGMLVEV